MESTRSLITSTLIAGALFATSTLTPAGAQTFYETTKVLASDGYHYDDFGSSSAIDGSLAVIGAQDHGENGFLSGGAYVFDISDPHAPTEIAKLLPIGGHYAQFFGCSVGISGTTVIVGADEFNDPISGPGTAYLFDAMTGNQLFELNASDGQANDSFGNAVAIDGSIVIVGAEYDSDNGDGSGSAYLFDASDGTQLAKLKPADGAFQDAFGFSVAIEGTTALIGAPYDDDNGFTSGSVYLFDTTTGAELTKLLPSDGAPGDGFGGKLVIQDSVALISAFGSDNSGVGSGAVYIFDISNPTTPVQLAKIIPSDANTLLARAVAISGDHALVGASFNDGGSNPRRAVLFDISDPTNPSQVALFLASDGAEFDWFGRSVALNGTTALVTAPGDTNILGSYAGSAYLFNLNAHPNDECANPDAIAGEGTFSFDTTGASAGHDPATTGSDGQHEALCLAFGTSAIQNDIWYSWSASLTGLATVSLCNGGTTLDTKLAAWPAACPPVAGTALACNDDSCSYQSEIQFNVTANTTYLIQIGSFNSSATGSGTFEISIQAPPDGPGVALCFGDGTGTPCPCNNLGALGEGCANGSGSGAYLTGSGTESVAFDNLLLSGRNLTPGPGLYFQGNNAINQGDGNPFGDGLRCVGNQVVRLEVRFSSGGTSTTTVSIPTKGGVSVGDTKRYQLWYRDASSSPCNTGFNLTNAYRVTWTL